MDEPIENTPKETNETPPHQEAKQDDGKATERARVLALLEITDDPKELKKFIEDDVDPSKAALQVLKQMRSEKKKAASESGFPSAFVTGSGSSKVQETITLAKKMGVIR